MPIYKSTVIDCRNMYWSKDTLQQIIYKMLTFYLTYLYHQKYLDHESTLAITQAWHHCDLL